MRISRKRNKCYAFRSSAKESQATLCSFMEICRFRESKKNIPKGSDRYAKTIAYAIVR